MGTTNIFRIATSELGPEDRFTSFLHYLVEYIPSIGQGMVDVICQSSGLGSATFEKAVDHPAGDDKNKPDFLLACKEFDILCEHKLGSELGNDQLERYLGLVSARPTYLALITNRPHIISEHVLQSSSYLRPKDSPTPNFYWEDFYPLIASHSDRLAQDFMGYMRDLGMAPSPLSADWVQLFERPDVATKFYEATLDMRTYFNDEIKAHCHGDQLKLGFQVRYPTKWLHLFYFYVSDVAKPPVLGIEPPYLVARVFVKEADAASVERLVDAEIPTQDGMIVGRVKNEPAGWGENLVLRYEYLGSLENYLTAKTTETRTKLLGFAKTVFEHVTNAPTAG